MRHLPTLSCSNGGFSSPPRLRVTHPLALSASVSISGGMLDNACYSTRIQISLCRSGKRNHSSTVSRQHWHVLHSLHSEDDWLENNQSLHIKDESNSFLGMILGKAAEAFLRTRLDHCSELKISIGGSNRELLRGQARRLKVIAKGAVYKGIFLSDVQLTTSPVHLKYRFLKQPLSINANIRILEEDLAASLNSQLLSMALCDLFSQSMVSKSGVSAVALNLEEGLIYLSPKNPRSYQSQIANPKVLRGQVPFVFLPAALRFEVKDDGQALHVQSLSIGHSEDTNESYPSQCIQRKFMLGPEVFIKELKIKKQEVLVKGNFVFSPR